MAKKAGSVKPKEWTVMLYMTAVVDSQPERAEETERAAIRDLEELQKVGTTDEMNVIVQLDRRWPGHPERYCVRQGYSELLECRPYLKKSSAGDLKVQKNASSGDPGILGEFLDWGRTNFPARRYLLVLWGHAYGLGFGRDHGNALTLSELAQTFEGRKLDILGANACAMSYAEAAYELRTSAKFLVASEIAMPFAGWPYEEILKEIVSTPNIETKFLGKRIVELFMESFGRRNVALTLLDLAKADNLDGHVKELAGSLDRAVRQNGTGNEIAEAFLDTAHGDVRPLIDLFDLCNNLSKVPDARIKDAADAMREFLEPGPESFVIKHKTGPELGELHGVGIFALSVTGAADLMRLELSGPDYKKLELMKGNAWARLVFKNLKDLLEPVNKEVAEFVKGTGAAGLEERTGVAQLLMGVHRSFVKLEKTLASAQATVTSALNGVTPSGLGTKPTATDQQRLAMAVRLAPPYLRLAEHLPLEQQQSVKAALAAQAPITPSGLNAGNGGDQAAAGPFEPVVQSLAELEKTLANVERTTKKVLTHSTLGLGPGIVKSGLGAEDFKSGLGAEDFKSGLGAEDFKAGLGAEDFKSGLGVLPWPMAASGATVASQDGVTTVAELYGRVAWSLQVSEQALAKLENVVRAVLTSPMYGLNFEGGKYRERATEQVEQSFRTLSEMVANARQIAGLVLAHPTYGLGPGIQPGLGTSDREMLAAAGGLSPRLLRLL